MAKETDEEYFRRNGLPFTRSDLIGLGQKPAYDPNSYGQSE